MEFEKTSQEFEEYIQDLANREDPENGTYEYVFMIEEFQQSKYKSLDEIFSGEYKSYINEQIYFYGCPYTIYSSTYAERLKEYINDLQIKYGSVEHVTSENVFIENELKTSFKFNPFLFVNTHLGKILTTSLFKRNEFLKKRLNQLDNKPVNEKEFPDYCKIGSLFAQGIIDKDGKRYNCNGVVIKDYKDYKLYLSDYVEDIAKVRQYIQATFNGSGAKYLYTKPKMKKIIDYCNANNLIITDEFNNIYNLLNN